jgi:hypothetical protein
VAGKDAEILTLADSADYQRLCQKYGFRFLVAKPVSGALPSKYRLTLIYSDAERRVFKTCD